jgi:hypothetical protein
MPFGLGKKEVPQTSPALDREDEQEIKKIANRLDKDEQVVIVAKQSRLKPGGSKVTPDTIFVTNKRIIIRNPSMMGMRENFWSISYDKISSIDLERGMLSSEVKILASGYSGDIDAIDKTKAEQIVSYAKQKMGEAESRHHTTPSKLSVADELAKLAKLKEQGIISDVEFQQMKQDLLKKAN